MAFFCDSCKLSCRQRRKEHVPLKEPVDLREIQHFRQRHCLRVEPCTAADKDPFRLCRRQSLCQRGNGLQMGTGKLPAGGNHNGFPTGQRVADLLIGTPPEDHRLSGGKLPEPLLLSGNVPRDFAVFSNGTAPVEGGDQCNVFHDSSITSIIIREKMIEAPI